MAASAMTARVFSALAVLGCAWGSSCDTKATVGTTDGVIVSSQVPNTKDVITCAR